MATCKKVTATGDVISGPRMLLGVILTPAAAVATLDVRLDGSGGTVVASLQAAANGGSVPVRFIPPGLQTSTIHATLAGAGASAAFEFD